MRIILYSSSSSDEVLQEVMYLREVRGYQAFAYSELALPSYEGQGVHISPLDVRHNLVVELLRGAALVLHPSTEPASVVTLRHLCDFMGSPLYRLRDLPEFAPEGQEEIDALRALAIAERPAPKTIPSVDLRSAEIRNNEVVELPRTLRDVLRGLWDRLLRWEQRFNARYGHALKNPVSRTLQEGQAKPRPYEHITTKPFVTG